MSNHPEWMYPGDDLHLNDPHWHDIYVGVGANDDQAGLLFMRVESHMDNDEAIVGLRLEDAKAIRDYLNGWIPWAESYLSNLRGKQVAA